MKKLIKKIRDLINKIFFSIEDDEAAEQNAPASSTTTPDNSSAVEEIKIESFGSPNVSKAKENKEAQIKDFKMSKEKMSYKWSKGGCERLGASSSTDYSHTICVCGYSNDGKTFKCGKFDWISTSRTSRSFENIHTGYNKWNSEEFFSAKKHCFFIVSSDGKNRTNVITD